MDGKVDLLVADSGAFIKGAPLQEWSENVVTVKEVVTEIRDARTRQRLQFLPYNLTFREPSHSAIQHVTAFAKKTGDYFSLSAVDIRVIALTYQLDTELRGTEPQPQTSPELEACATEQACEQALSSSVVSNDESLHSSGSTVGQLEQSMGTLGLSTEALDGSIDIEREGGGEQPIDSSVAQEEECDGGGEEEGGVAPNGSSGGDDDGWITPENIRQVCERMGGVMEERPNDVKVGCITTDFAMQLGLHVISTEGMLIKQLKTYALQCKACFRTSFKMADRFCSFCGNRMLMRVSTHVRPDGTVEYHSLSSKQFSHRGLRYSLPLPKGGRRPDKLILAPDQKVTFKFPRSREKVNPLDPNYVALSSPFQFNDVNSKGAQIGFRKGRSSGGVPKDGWRKNPNRVKSKKK